MANSATATLGVLPQADGSALFTQGRTKVIASVNGPIEVRPRDELPQEAYIELSVRPSAGVTSVREKFLESRILSAIKPIILRTNHPRTLIQIVIQVIQSASSDDSDDNFNAVALLSPALNAATLALVDAGVPMKCMLAATTIAVAKDGTVVVHPDSKDVKRAESLHVFGYGFGRVFDKGVATRKRVELAFLESQGSFGVGILESVGEVAKKLCVPTEEDEVRLDDAKGEKIGDLMQSWVKDKIERDLRYRQ